MLNFCKLGQKALEQYVTHFVIGEPSTSGTVRRSKILTMAPLKTTRRKISQKEKENKLVTTCLRRRLAWCNRTGLKYNSTKEQYSLDIS